MGLAERRVIKDFQENHLPALKKQVDEAAGFEVPLEVNWEQLSANAYAHAWLEDWPKIYFQPLIAALKQVAQDEMGKEALHESLKKIVIQDHSGACYGNTWSQFEDGTLTLDHAFTNMDDVNDRSEGLIVTLEQGL